MHRKYSRITKRRYINLSGCTFPHENSSINDFITYFKQKKIEKKQTYT